MGRLAILLITRRWGWIIIGIGLVIGGAVYGLSSHQVAYQASNNPGAQYTPYVLADGTDYLQRDNGSTYFRIDEQNFSPAFNGNTIFGSNKHSLIKFIARTDGQDVDVSLTDGSHIQGTAYIIEQITFYDSNGQNPTTYANSEYTQNPNGFYQNNWLGGAGLIFGGLVAGVLAFVFPMLFKGRRRASSGYSITPASVAAGTAMPGQPHEQPYMQPQPYQGPAQYPQYQQPQPYQGPAQYPQYPQYQQPQQYPQPQGPGNAGQYGNPYNQPPQR